jgi:glycosyltransferase involved in cell wall biosynthesis
MRYQADALRSLGFGLTTVVGREEGVVLDGTRVLKYRWTGGRPKRILNHYAAFWKLVAGACCPADYDVLYLRHPGTNPAILGFLGWMKMSNPELRIVLEVASYPFRGEADSIEQKLIVASDVTLSRLLPRFVDYVVTFGDQREIYGIPCIPSSNGVDVEALPMRLTPDFSRKAPRFLGVASLAKWHGYDRVLRGLRDALDRSSDFAPHLDLAGQGPASGELQALARDLGLDDHVTFHGMTTGPALDALFDRNDIAIASLGMHRIGLESASSLKTREYCARGIPFICAGPDGSFDESFGFALRVAVGESPVDLFQIVEDYAAMLDRSGDPAVEMRAYAASNLSWKTRLAEIMQVALG